MSGAIERLIRWRDVGDGPTSYTAGNIHFGSDVLLLLDINADLLAALEAMLATPEIADCDPRDKDEETRVAERMARAAIAKAKGETT